MARQSSDRGFESQDGVADETVLRGSLQQRLEVGVHLLLHYQAAARLPRNSTRVVIYLSLLAVQPTLIDLLNALLANGPFGVLVSCR